jgi:diguanylate cyclase (GGDEF)-like protein/PAS domain S-box-containing protein
VDLGNHTQFQAALAQTAADTHGPPVLGRADATEMLQFALKGAGAGIWELDLATRTLWLCPNSLQMLGLPDSHSGLLAREQWQQMVDHDDVERLLEPSSSSTDGVAPYTREFRIHRSDGAIRWLRIMGRTLRGQEGRAAKLVGLQFDETDRKRAEEAVRESEKRLLLVQEAALIGTYVTDANRRTIGSRQFYRNFGLPEDTEFLDHETRMNLIHPDDRERLDREITTALASAEGIDTEYRIHRADTGEMRWIFARMKFERAEDGGLMRILGAHLDITEPKRAEAALHDSVALNQSMIDASADCVKLLDLDGRLLFMNQQGLAALEIVDASALWGNNWARLWPKPEAPKVEAAIKAAREGQVGRFDGGCPTATGKSKWWDVIVTPIRDEHDQPRQLLAISRDVTEHRDNLARIRWTGSHDMLTELPNRRYFQHKLESALADATARGTQLSLLQIDVDDFKQVNDALGHDAGDALLKTFAQRLKGVAQDAGLVCRLGGDEFAIIVPNLTGSHSIASIIDAIQESLKAPFVYQGCVFDCRASIGYALFPRHGTTVDELLKSADIALYAAKTSGRGGVQLFNPSMRAEMQRRLVMINRARRALNDDKIMPYYQPKIDLRTQKAAGFEALLRWDHPNNGVQLPASIGAAFDDLEIAQSLSERMQVRVLADMRRWLDDGIDFGHVAINASAAEFRQNGFAERLLERVSAAGMPTRYIELEVTETVFLGRGADYVERALRLLSVEGIRIALDDFGTGYASLSHLKQFPVDVIKIDQTFVRDLEVDPDDAAIIRALIGLGQSLSIDIVAEGVENHAQAAFLEKQGCDYGQGFLFGKPVAASAVPELLAKYR